MQVKLMDPIQYGREYNKLRSDYTSAGELKKHLHTIGVIKNTNAHVDLFLKESIAELSEGIEAIEHTIDMINDDILTPIDAKLSLKLVEAVMKKGSDLAEAIDIISTADVHRDRIEIFRAKKAFAEIGNRVASVKKELDVIINPKMSPKEPSAEERINSLVTASLEKIQAAEKAAVSEVKKSAAPEKPKQ